MLTCTKVLGDAYTLLAGLQFINYFVYSDHFQSNRSDWREQTQGCISYQKGMEDLWERSQRISGIKYITSKYLSHVHSWWIRSTRCIIIKVWSRTVLCSSVSDSRWFCTSMKSKIVCSDVLKRAASWIGFKANRELGLEYLRECYASNSVRSHFAGIIVALNHLMLNPSLHKERLQLNIDVRSLSIPSIYW